jgi:hypothetical protein
MSMHLMDQERVLFSLSHRSRCYHQFVHIPTTLGWGNDYAGCGSVDSRTNNVVIWSRTAVMERFGKRPCKRCYPEVKT